MFKIKPHLHLEGYLSRWHLIPHNRFCNIYLHKFMGNDDERFLHDHPWHNFSIRVWGPPLWEIYRPMYGAYNDSIGRVAPRFCFRRATFAHRLMVFGPGRPTWTLFITGPKIRKWGFLCPNGWVHWRELLTPDGNPIPYRD